MSAVHEAAPRVLVTGFGPFPGAAVNPTQALVEGLRTDPPNLDGLGSLRTAILDVEYATIGGQLSGAATGFDPDIAVHFGLANECRGFRLEKTARNSHAGARTDNAGALPAAATICEAPATLSSSLPLQEIAVALAAKDLPVEWSDDAGGYLCNAVFTLSRAGACDGLAPAMSGFVHVPLVGEGPDFAMSADGLREGALTILAACVAAWRSGRGVAGA